MNKSKPPKLGTILVKKEYLTKEARDLAKKIQSQNKKGLLFGEVCIRMGLISWWQLSDCLQEQKGVECNRKKI
ncbi:hypothetical protein ACFL2G_00765, partial [Candidatus Omnitrophota bacterium]